MEYTSLQRYAQVECLKQELLELRRKSASCSGPKIQQNLQRTMCMMQRLAKIHSGH